MCLNEPYKPSKVRIHKYWSDAFPIQSGLKQEGALSPLLFNFAWEYTIKKIKELGGIGTRSDIPTSALYWLCYFTGIQHKYYTEIILHATKWVGVETNTKNMT